MNILGIETSCDETAAAVVRDGKEICSSVVSSQIELHRPYGGVVPELASRKHIEMIASVVSRAVSEADLAKRDLDAVAVTRGPGLVGSLLVGLSFAKAFSYTLDIPWVGVDHLDGHLNAVFLQPDPPPFPFVALLVSGGHTNLYHVRGHIRNELMGQTRDDAAGEAFDKVAKMLGLGYPGGRVIEEMARRGDPRKIEFPRTYLDKNSFDFSFSGIKTSVNRFIQTHSPVDEVQCADIAAGFQEAVTDVLADKSLQAALWKECRHLALVGGVAANGRLRKKVLERALPEGITLHVPPVSLCGDNAAMIAAAGFHYLAEGIVSELGEDAYSRRPLL